MCPFRLLAYAGFDARDAVKFWETRGDESDCASARNPELDDKEGIQAGLARSIMGRTHPVIESRIESLKQELVRWEEAKFMTLAHVNDEEELRSSIIESS